MLIKWESMSSGQRILATSECLILPRGRSPIMRWALPRQAYRKWKLSKPSSQAAKLLQINKRTGAIRKALETDIVIVGANPLSSIEALKDIRNIVNDRQVVFNRVEQ